MINKEGKKRHNLYAQWSKEEKKTEFAYWIILLMLMINEKPD